MVDATHEALLALSREYAAAADACDLGRFRATFTEDGVLAVTAIGDPTRVVSERTGDALAEIIDRIGRFDRTEHRVGTGTFVLESDAGSESGCEAGPEAPVATGRVSTEAHHLTSTQFGTTDWVLTIEYADRYVRTPEGWRIAHRTVEVLSAETVRCASDPGAAS